ncbi:MAG TPA: TIGR01777 family protein [Chitinophagaceae bacterium]|nr:TIGR01777 family protein [Chitinophagaceae bacterium]
METVIITGGTGLIGTAMSKFLLSRGFQVIILTRDPKAHRSSVPGISYAAWNIEEQSANEEAFQKAKYVIHLAGAGVVDKPWTNKRKKEIVESRTRSSELLIKAMTSIPNKIVSVVSASAIGWYREILSQPAVETDPPDPGFLGETCRAWENAIQPVRDLGKRLVILRTGIVLSNEGGAFPEFVKPVKYGIAGILGSGKQIISWIHIEDICRIYLEAMLNPAWSGVYNAVAPNPVNNRTFTVELAKRIKGNFFIQVPVPNFILRTLLGGRSEEVLKSSHISANKLKQQGFQFIYPTIDAAFRDLIPR